MSAESSLLGTAVGMAVGTLGWVVGLGELVWPEHSQMVLFLVVIGVAIASALLLERNERRNSPHAHT